MYDVIEMTTAIVVPPAQQKELSCDVAPSSAKYENNSFSVP